MSVIAIVIPIHHIHQLSFWTSEMSRTSCLLSRIAGAQSPRFLFFQGHLQGTQGLRPRMGKGRGGDPAIQAGATVSRNPHLALGCKMKIPIADNFIQFFSACFLLESLTFHLFHTCFNGTCVFDLFLLCDPHQHIYDMHIIYIYILIHRQW